MDETSTPYLRKLCHFAHAHQWVITATTNGHHNPGSLHPLGRAIDASVWHHTEAEIEDFMHAARNAGFHVIDERHRLPGEHVWGGPHLHLEDREGLNGG